MTKQRGGIPDGFSFQAIVYLIGGIVALFLICSTVLLCLDKDIQAFLMVGNLMVSPLLGLLGIKAYQTVAGKMDNLERQVNGRMTTLIDHAKNSVPLDKVDKVETK